MIKLDLSTLDLSQYPIPTRLDGDVSYLEWAAGVRRLKTAAYGWREEVTCAVLQAAAPTLEELSLQAATNGQLAAALTMPRLRRLEVVSCEELTYVLPPGKSGGKLHWLSLYGDPPLSYRALMAMLKQHSATLEKLQLSTGIRSEVKKYFPNGYMGARIFLKDCQLNKLRELVLLPNTYGYIYNTFHSVSYEFAGTADFKVSDTPEVF